MQEDKSTTRCKGSKLFWSKIWERKEHYRMAEQVYNMEKELQRLEESQMAIIYL